MRLWPEIKQRVEEEYAKHDPPKKVVVKGCVSQAPTSPILVFGIFGRSSFFRLIPTRVVMSSIGLGWHQVLWRHDCIVRVPDVADTRVASEARDGMGAHVASVWRHHRVAPQHLGWLESWRNGPVLRPRCGAICAVSPLDVAAARGEQVLLEQDRDK